MIAAGLLGNCAFLSAHRQDWMPEKAKSPGCQHDFWQPDESVDDQPEGEGGGCANLRSPLLSKRRRNDRNRHPGRSQAVLPRDARRRGRAIRHLISAASDAVLTIADSWDGVGDVPDRIKLAVLSRIAIAYDHRDKIGAADGEDSLAAAYAGNRIVIASGRFDRLVTIMHEVTTPDSIYGTPIVTWEELATVPANVQDILPSRGERIAEGINIARRPARVRLCWRDEIDSTMRFNYEGRVLQIIACPAEIGRRESVEFIAEELSTTT